jgi:hypothetical protein
MRFYKFELLAFEMTTLNFQLHVIFQIILGFSFLGHWKKILYNY